MTDTGSWIMNLEGGWLQSLEASHNKISAELAKFTPQTQPRTPAEIAAIIDYVHRCINYLRDAFEQAALRLSEMGHTRLLLREQAIVADLRNAESAYMEMHSSALASEARMAQIQQDASQVWLKTVQDSMSRRQQMFDKINRQWSANFTNTCVHCNYYLGDAYHYTEMCPRCGRLLKGAI